MFTTYSRERDGNQASSVHDLGDNRELHIRTSRWFDASLVTNATVHRVDSNARIHVMGFGTGGGDFNQRLASTRPARITAKAVMIQHDGCLSQLQQVIAAVNQHYGDALASTTQAAHAV